MVNDNTLDWSMFTDRQSNQTVSKDSTGDLPSQPSASSSTEVSKNIIKTCYSLFYTHIFPLGFYFGLYDSLKPILLPKDAGFLISFALGYGKF